MMFSGDGHAIATWIAVATVLPAILIFGIWHAGDIVRLIRDTINQRDFVAESETDRSYDGRLLTHHRNVASTSTVENGMPSEGPDSKPHVAGGCLVFGLCMLGTGSAALLQTLWVAFNAWTSPVQTMPNWLPFALELTFFFLFSACWLSAGVFALQMRHTRSIIFFLGGICCYVLVGYFR